jgi:parvulin-like peptidyl-prolyl isomerase
VKSTTKAWIAAGIGTLFSVGLIFWQVRVSRAAAINLSPDDMSLIAADLAPQMRMRLASDDNARKEFAKNVREILALAEEARAKGYANKPEVKRQLELARAFIIAQNYEQAQAGAPPISDADIEAFFKEPAQEERLKQFIADLKARNPMMAGQDIPQEQMQEIRHQLGRVLVGERRGVAAGIDKQRKTELQILLQQARSIGSMYADDSLSKQLKATPAEIDEYMKAHPEEQVHARHILISMKSAERPSEEGEEGLDKNAARAKAEEVLKRVKAGENFESLAREYSTDPGSKQNGGDLGWFGHGQMVPEFEKAAFALQPGQTSEIVESQFGFHIIKLEAKRNGDPEKASQEVEQEKAKKLIDEIVKRQGGHVTVAENFAVQAPPPQQMQPAFPFEPQAPAAATPAPKGKNSPAKKH